MPSITKLGKYTIRRELGKGGMGVVYEGYDPVIERTVAIKTVLPSQLNSDEAAGVLARFKREAQAAGRLNHPGIVAVYEYGEVVAEDDRTLVSSPNGAVPEGEPVAFIAMEFVPGKELKEFFDANERFALKEVARIMVEILEALEHAHSKGVTHRDMKPANLFMMSDGRIKIADFGIARIETSQLTQVGTVMGTAAYMSPEQFMGQVVDGRSDLFSCGVILYQFLTGEKPFTGTQTTIMYKVLREEPLPPSTLNAALPSAWDAVVQKAIAKNPDDRFQTAKEFAAAVVTALQSQNEEKTVVTPRAATMANDATVINIKKPAAPAAPVGAGAKKSIPVGPLAAGVAALALLGLGGAYFMQGKAGGSPAASQPAAVAPIAASENAQEPGSLVISALGLANPKDPKFGGDPAAAQSEARADASRQLIEKALALYVDKSSLDKNYRLIEQKLLSQSGSFIKAVLYEGAPVNGKDGLIESQARAVIKMREVLKSLNQLSKEERVEFIRNNGDPKVSISMSISNADTAQALPAARSVLAENVLKERIKSFGFRVWSTENETSTGPKAQSADFAILGEAKFKQLSAKLEASGLTINKTVLTSWTIKAIDKSTGEEIYLNTVLPKGQSWASEDQALADIGKAVGDEFSKKFFLEHFNFGTKKASLNIAGLPDKKSANLILRELRGMRPVLDVELVAATGKYQLQLAEGNATSLVQDAILRPLNSKLGQNCFVLAGSSESEINVTFSEACSAVAVLERFEIQPPAGLGNAPESRGRSLLQGLKTT